MSQVTIIGAGAMGSALTVPLVRNNHRVKLWGTELDQEIIGELKEGKDHPKHKHPLPSKVLSYYSHELEEAMEGSEFVIMAITSDALGQVFERVVPYLKKDMIIGTVSKGFGYNEKNEIVILTEVLGERLPKGREHIPIVAIGGPCKANEVVFESPTNVIYVSDNIKAARTFKEIIQTDVYNVMVDEDVIGVELCAAMKNAYAISLGFAEGFKDIAGYTHNNTKSALFTIAIDEMMQLAEALGGMGKSAIGLAGAGDLEVTGEAGRNRILGEVIGGGMASSQAIKKMRDEDITVEGYSAVDFGYRLSLELARKGKIPKEGLTLLNTLYEILYEDRDCYQAIKKVTHEYYDN